MANVTFTRSIVALCRKSLSGNRVETKSAEDQMSALLQPQCSDIELKIASIFRIILAPSAISMPANTLSDDELGGLKLASADVQLWAAIFLKNYIRSKFEASESYGGVGDRLRQIIKSFVLISTLNGNKVGIDQLVAKQLEEALLIIADVDFPYSMEYSLPLISYCHMSDVNPDAVTSTLAARLHKEISAREKFNIHNCINLENSQSLARSLDESQSAMHLSYADNLIKLIDNYTKIQQTILAYHNVLEMNNMILISRSYFDFFRNLLAGIETMCEISKTIKLKDIGLGKFLQASAAIFPQTTLNTHISNPATNSYEVICSPTDSLFFFDDRKLYKDAALWQSCPSLPEFGAPQHAVQVILTQPMFLTDRLVNFGYYKDKLKALSILRKFMKKYKTRTYEDETLSELKIILVLCDMHLLHAFKSCMNKLGEYMLMFSSQHTVTSGAANLTIITLDLLEIISNITKIFCYTHAIDLPESFEDNAQLYFSGFVKLLHFNDPYVVKHDSRGIIIKMKIAICKLFRYYAERYQEVFHPFVFTCIEDVVSICRTLSQEECDDKLCSAALNFLSSAASTHWTSPQPFSTRRSPFMNTEFLAEIIQTVILPNIGFRECDLYLLEDCPIEFVQRELDSGSGHSRRFSSITFLKKLVTGYGEMCKKILNEYAKNVAARNDYKLKELYLQLVICSNFKEGYACEFDVNKYFVDHLKNDFLRESQVHQPKQENILIILAIIKYIYTFRKSISEIEMVSVVPLLVSFFRHQNEAVQSFAAEAIGRILPLLVNCRLQLKSCLLQGLEYILNMMRDGRCHNEFYIKCTMKIFLFLREDIREAGLVMVELIIGIIKKVSDNPVNPVYNHYLFECLSILLRIHLHPGTNSVTSSFALEKIEETLIPTLALIIQQELHSFIPYSLQILYLLLKSATKPSATYVQLLNHLACIDSWRISIANAQGAIKLLVCYFAQHRLFEPEIMTNMENILSIFHFCLTHRRLGVFSFDLLNGIIRYLPIRYYSKFLKSLVTVLLTFAHNVKTGDVIVKMTTSIAMLTTCLHIQQHSPSFMEILESIQSGIGVDFIKVVYLPNARKVLSVGAKKIHAIATSKIITSPQIQGNADLFRMLLEFLCDLISGENMIVDSPKGELGLDKTFLENLDSNAEVYFDVSYVKLRTVDDTEKGKEHEKLLDPNVNVEQTIKGLLSPLAPIIMANASIGGEYTALFALIS